MVKVDKSGAYTCEECSFKYSERDTAAKCEKWCKEHHSCNMEIIKKSMNYSE